MVGKADPGSQIWQAGRFCFDLSGGGLVMGILNVTPDSFSDGAAYGDVGEAVDRALEMVGEGADIIDVGGESTRPGAAAVSAEEELGRVVPVVEGIRGRCGVAISVDTSKAAVAEAAVAAGADIVNDVTGLGGDPGMLGVVAATDAGVVVMHMRGDPRTMQAAPRYGDVVAEVGGFLRGQVAKAEAAGVGRGRLVVDPGIGFGKTLGHNLELLRAVPELLEGVGRPVLIGVSRKSFFGKLAGAEEVGDRLWPTVALTSYCRELGAGILRVHDVAENVQALKMTEAILSAG